MVGIGVSQMLNKTRGAPALNSAMVEFDDIFANPVSGDDSQTEYTKIRISDYLVIPLTVNERDPNLLSSDPDGVLYCVDTQNKMPAGYYIVHIFDSVREAVAGRHIMQAMSMVTFGNLYWTTSGESELPTGEACIVQKTSGMVRPDVSVLTETGETCIQIQDCRVKHPDNKPISLSIEWHCDDIIDLYTKAGCLEPYSRAKIIVRAIAEMSINCTCLRLIQREIETIPGADISLSAISTEDVYEALEDKLLSHDVKAHMPSVHEVHGVIKSALPFVQKYGQEAVIDQIAETFAEKIVQGQCE